MKNMNKRSCKRCEYEWEKRAAGEPRQCPFCKSPKWAVARLGAPVVPPVVVEGKKPAQSVKAGLCAVAKGER